MTAVIRLASMALSANEQFKLQYRKTLRWAALIAVLATLVGAWLSPKYEAHPYVLRHTEMVIIPPLDEPVDIKEPAQPVPPPEILRPIQPVEGDDPNIDVYPDIPWEPVPLPTGPVYPDDTNFVASSANPRLLHYVKPDYPTLARHAGLEGTVLLKVLVGPDGKVIDAVVVRGPHPLLEQAALKAARRCEFAPARQREMPVKAWIAVPYNFSLR